MHPEAKEELRVRFKYTVLPCSLFNPIHIFQGMNFGNGSLVCRVPDGSV